MPKFVFPEGDPRDWAESALFECVMGADDEANLNPLGLEILNATECEYLLSVVKKKIGSQDLEHYFSLAKVTCEVLVVNMVSPDVIQHILGAHYVETSEESLTKLLFRVRQMH